jgi:delta 1-pyrroline-5-carboxylate dehydrogenase|tara:strand:+ start:1060 stop:1824 length:765 start_codon:yes stop_codon:yes gene_type:complete
MAKAKVPPPVSALEAMASSVPPQAVAIAEKFAHLVTESFTWVMAQDKKALFACLVALVSAYVLIAFLLEPAVPKISVQLTEQERKGIPGKKWKVGTKFGPDTIPCYDPGTLEMLGPDMKAMSADEVKTIIGKAKVAQAQWKKSSWKQRKLLLKVIARFILDNQDDICKVSARDSGKPLVDAAFGEILVTLEKIKWLLRDGQKWLSPERRTPGRMMFYKKATVEYRPVGVMGAIVPWNYPVRVISQISTLFTAPL